MGPSPPALLWFFALYSKIFSRHLKYLDLSKLLDAPNKKKQFYSLSEHFEIWVRKLPMHERVKNLQKSCFSQNNVSKFIIRIIKNAFFHYELHLTDITSLDLFPLHNPTEWKMSSAFLKHTYLCQQKNIFRLFILNFDSDILLQK